MSDRSRRVRNIGGTGRKPDAADSQTGSLASEIERGLRQELDQMFQRMNSPESSTAYDLLERITAKDLSDRFRRSETLENVGADSICADDSRTGNSEKNTTDPNTPELARLVKDTGRVLLAAAELSGDFRRALDWFNTKLIEDFDGRSAAQLVADGKAEAVLAYLQTQQSGATG